MEFLHNLKGWVFDVKESQQFEWKHRKAYEIQNAIS